MKLQSLIQRKPKQKERYFPMVTTTMDIHATNVLPKSEKLRFIHPKVIEIPNIAVRREKIIIENMSSAVRKAPLPFMGIALVLMFGGIGVGIGAQLIWGNLIEPYIDKSVDIQAKIQRGELPPDTKQPSLFDFKIPIPGLN